MMKRMIGGAFAAIALGLAPRMACAAGAMPIDQWSGLYFGAQAGYEKGSTRELYTESGLDWWHAGSEGATAGAFLGYNHLLPGNLLVGGEIEGNATSLTGHYFNSYYGGDYFDHNWSVAARVRFGYLPAPNTLLYASAGIATGNFDYSKGYFNYYGGTVYSNPNLTLTGLQLGMGAETFLSPQWSIRAEAIYTRYGPGVIAYDGDHYQVTPDVLTARVGLAYHPGWLGQPSAPVAVTEPKANWNGLYFGGDLGLVSLDSIEDYYPTYYAPSFDTGGLAVVPGVHAGFNWQSGPMVAGLEADVAGSGPSFMFDYEPEGQQNWSAGMRARLGFLISSNVLVYGTAGWAASGFHYVAAADGSGDYHDATSFTAGGLQVGGGIETFVLPQLSVRLEGLYTDYGTHVLTYEDSPYWQVSLHTLEGQVGVSYHLN